MGKQPYPFKIPEGHCDYINASPISLHNMKTGKEEKYIATQVV
jgi:protein tyrosine phosphatase